jgi:hypothetical protein
MDTGQCRAGVRRDAEPKIPISSDLCGDRSREKDQESFGDRVGIAERNEASGIEQDHLGIGNQGRGSQGESLPDGFVSRAVENERGNLKVRQHRRDGGENLPGIPKRSTDIRHQEERIIDGVEQWQRGARLRLETRDAAAGGDLPDGRIHKPRFTRTTADEKINYVWSIRRW